MCKRNYFVSRQQVFMAYLKEEVVLGVGTARLGHGGSNQTVSIDCGSIAIGKTHYELISSMLRC